jgi:hypothetical protein
MQTAAAQQNKEHLEAAMYTRSDPRTSGPTHPVAHRGTNMRLFVLVQGSTEYGIGSTRLDGRWESDEEQPPRPLTVAGNQATFESGDVSPLISDSFLSMSRFLVADGKVKLGGWVAAEDMQQLCFKMKGKHNITWTKQPVFKNVSSSPDVSAQNEDVPLAVGICQQVKTLQNEAYEIKAAPTDTVAELKRIIVEQESYEREGMELILKGRVLQDHDKLEGLGVNDGDFMMMVGKRASPEVSPVRVMQFMNSKLERPKVLHIYDSGGQDCFMSLHDVMTAPGGTCYVLVFSLVELHNPLTQMEAVAKLEAQLATIAVHAANAPILLVGTRKDAVTAQQGQAALVTLSTLLHSHLSQRSPSYKWTYPDGELCFFAVENSRGFAGDESIQRLAVAIDKATDSLPTMQKEVPAGWLKVYDELRRRLTVSEPEQWLRLDEVQSIAAQCGLPHRGLELKYEVHAMLLLFHSLCAVLWFDEPGLRQLVILDPQWLIDGVTCVVRNFTLHPMPAIDKACERHHETEWAALRLDARLSLKLLPLLWADNRFAEHTDLLLQLMVRFGLAVPIRGKNELIIPPLLIFSASKPLPIMMPSGALQIHLHFAYHEPAPATGDGSDGVNQNVELPPEPLWKEEDMKRGFLPAGAFHQLCVAAVGWCFHTVMGFEPSLSKSHAFVRFGHHRLLISRAQGQPRVVVELLLGGTEGKGALEVLDRLRLLLPYALRHFPNLRCSLLLPLRDGYYVHHEALELLAAGTKQCVLGKSELNHVEVSALLRPWLPTRSVLEVLHVFLSYRWGEHDSSMADVLYDTLSTLEMHDGMPLRVFQDKRRLRDGERFDLQFMQAMLKSMVVAPLLSWDALKRMTALTVDSACDNVLLEWSLAVELHERFGTKVLPLLIGSQTTGEHGASKMENFFAYKPPKLRADGWGDEVDDKGLPVPDERGVIERVADVKVAAVHSRLDEFFASQKMSPCTKKFTAREVVKQLMLFLGIPVWEIKASHGGSGALAQYQRWGRMETLATKIKDVVMERIEQTKQEEQDGDNVGAPAINAHASAGSSRKSSRIKKDFRTSAVSASTAVLIEGSLLKRSTGALKRWQKRYFVVGGHYLKYADDEDSAHTKPKATVDLNALQQCTIKRGTFIMLRFNDDAVLEIQAATTQEAAGWREVLVVFEQATERKVGMLHSLDHYAPRKGTLVFERKGSFERKVPPASPPSQAAAAAAAATPPDATSTANATAAIPEPMKHPPAMRLPDRVSNLEGEAFGELRSGTTKARVEALETDVFGEVQSGSMVGRVEALEVEYGLR